MRNPEQLDKALKFLAEHPGVTFATSILAEDLSIDKKNFENDFYSIHIDQPNWWETHKPVEGDMLRIGIPAHKAKDLLFFLENGGFTAKIRKVENEEIRKREMEELDITSKTQAITDSKEALRLARRANRIALANVTITIIAVFLAWFLGRYSGS